MLFRSDIIVVFCYGKIYKDEKTGEVQAQIIVSDVTDTAPLSQVKTESSSYMEISEHDMLTGLYNRGSFEKRVNHDLALFNDGNCAIIVMDIRELKWINDTYGRSAGDMVINNMAANMVSIFRSDVVMSRIGGDEFCLYIPLYEEKMQQQYMDKIMQVAEQTTITGYPDVRIKVTVGTAVSSRFGTDFWQLYSSSGGLFPAFRTFFPYFLPLLSFLTRGRGRKHKQGKKQNKNEPMRTRFRF